MTLIPDSTRAQQVIDDLTKAGVQLVEFIYVDYDNIARGKTVNIKGLAHYIVDGVGLTLAQFAATARDEVLDVPNMTAVGESRMVPDLDTVRILPHEPRVATMMVNHLTQDQAPYVADPRVALQTVVAHAHEMGYTLKVAFENEFMLRNSTTGVPANDNLFASTTAMDFGYVFIFDILNNLEAMQITVDKYYPEAGTGQHELPLRPQSALRAADEEVWFQRIVKATVKQHGMTATFAPKPLLNTEGSGCHIHLSLWDAQGQNVFADATDAQGLSQTGYQFVAGVLDHIRGLMALTAASVNSYQRLQPGEWSSAYATFGRDNREAAIRIPSAQWHDATGTSNIELKASDGTENPYLALAGFIAAGLDGISRQLEPRTPVDVDPATLTDAERAALGVTRLPENLAAAISALKTDDFFTKTFGQTLIAAYATVKEREVAVYANMSPVDIATTHASIY